MSRRSGPRRDRSSSSPSPAPRSAMPPGSCWRTTTRWRSVPTCRSLSGSRKVRPAADRIRSAAPAAELLDQQIVEVVGVDQDALDELADLAVVEVAAGALADQQHEVA